MSNKNDLKSINVQNFSHFMRGVTTKAFTVYKFAGRIEPLAFYLYKNSLLTEQTMKGFLLTYKEYNKMYDKFDLKKLKSIYIEKDLKELENK